MDEKLKSIIYRKINDIRSLRPLTNCYSYEVIDRADRIWELNESFLFSYHDNGINRLVYYAADENAIDMMLDLVENGKYFLEFMTKDPDGYVPAGTSAAAQMMRLANPDCRMILEESNISQYADPSIGEPAQLDDVKEINEILMSIFHTEISHLPDEEHLKQSVKDGQFTVHRSERIDAVLQVNVLPRKFYINQVVNLTERRIIHAMLISRLQEYIENGGRYLYSWVEKDNIASLKWHRKYGMRHDGMWSMVYSLER